jgi:hypothetical protein
MSGEGRRCFPAAKAQAAIPIAFGLQRRHSYFAALNRCSFATKENGAAEAAAPLVKEIFYRA